MSCFHCSRRMSLALFLRWTLVVAAFALVVVGIRGAAHAADRPNVLLILGDDQAWNHFGFMGHPTIKTPNIDRLASQSITYTRGYVPASLCRPSLATIVTGLYPHQHKITGNDPAGNRFSQVREEQIAHIDKVPTLPRMLAEQGYVSLQTGKWWEGNYRRGGFTRGMTRGFPEPGGRHGDDGLKIGREGLGPIREFLDWADERPWLIWYAPFMPHTPHNPPERLLKKYTDKTDSIHVARYWAMCEWFDETIGELLGELDKRGQSDDTIVLFVTDNGWIQRTDAGRYAPRSKRSPHEGGIRTPIMVRWPGHAEPRRDEIHLASSIDLAPTVLDACGLEPTNAMQGVSLLDAEAVAAREAVFGDIYRHDCHDIHHPPVDLQYRWCIDGWWKLIWPNQPVAPTEHIELYNLKDDPHERTNLAEEHPERVDALKGKIDAWWPAE